MDYLPQINTLSGVILYSFIGYLISLAISYCLTPREYTIEDYREAIRRKRDS